MRCRKGLSDMVLPESIRSLIKNEEYEENNVGMSGSGVWMFREKVLKFERCGEQTKAESAMLGWLRGKVPVPQILAEEIREGVRYLLMSRVPGKMSCDEIYMHDPERLVKLLAKALRMLWSVDVAGCPVDNRLDRKLRQAEYCVENGLVDLENVEPETFGEGGFRDPGDLLEWLKRNKPEETPVLSHGDFCLPNIFLEGDAVSGFIDLGRCGIADKYQDIALCYRSLRHNFDGTYGLSYPGFEPMMLFRELGIDPDWEKIRYYILLDELF